MALEVLSIKATRMQDKFDLYNEIRKLVKKNNVSLQNGDVLVISSKYVSNSQGRVLDQNSIKSSKKAKEISKKFSINDKLSEAVIENLMLYLAEFLDL